MARCKQTARRSTGGKAPRKQLSTAAARWKPLPVMTQREMDKKFEELKASIALPDIPQPAPAETKAQEAASKEIKLLVKFLLMQKEYKDNLSPLLPQDLQESSPLVMIVPQTIHERIDRLRALSKQ